MFKKSLIMIGVISFLGGAVFFTACAQRNEKLEPASDVIGQEVVCPVMGNKFKITKHTPVIEYKGETYYFCCGGCDKDFAKNPGKYIQQMHTDEPTAADVDENMIGKELICPVTKDKFKITESTPVIEYKNIKYYMCCPGCDTEFMKNPENYIENLKEHPHSDNKNDDILYWTCSMHPEVKADEDGNCPICAMGLIPVYAKTGSGESLHLNDNAILLAGVKLAPAKINQLFNKIQTVGKVAYDPELVVAQEEYINAIEMITSLDGADKITMERAKKVMEKSRYKLRLLGMDDSEIHKLKMNKQVDKSLIMPEDKTWIYAELYESDIAWVKKGQKVAVLSMAYPDKEFTGRIISINPTLNDMTRSVQVRITLSNTQFLLKPGMYVDVIIKVTYNSPEIQKNGGIITVPKTAVLDTGNRKLVWVYLGDGNFEPRPVKTGPIGIVQIENHNVSSYPILDGIEENEVVVTNGNFLIDSESQITGAAALSYGGAMGIEETHETPDSKHEQ